MKVKQTSVRTVAKLFYISFISMCGQFKLLLIYFSLISFIFIFFNNTRSLVRYCISNFYLDEEKHCERNRQKHGDVRGMRNSTAAMGNRSICIVGLYQVMCA